MGYVGYFEGDILLVTACLLTQCYSVVLQPLGKWTAVGIAIVT